MTYDKKSIVQLPDPDGLNEIDAAAVDWVIRIDAGRLTSSEHQALHAWRTTSLAHEAALKRWAEVWGLGDSLFQRVATQIATEEVPARKPIFTPSRLAALTAIFALAFAFVSFIGPEKYSPPTLFATAIGEQQTVELEDGSTIEINTDTVLEVAMRPDSRVVSLLQGEAYFDISPDSRRPFYVYARDKVVKVVGTSFTVSALDDELSVTVVEGLVEVLEIIDAKASVTGNTSNLSEPIQLKPLDRLVAIRSEPLELAQIAVEDLDRALAWKAGYLVFESERLDSLISEVGRYSDVTIEISDPELADVEVSGRFKIDSIEALLDALELSFDLEATYEANGHIVLKRS